MVLFKKKLCYAKNAFPKRLFWKHENCSDKDKAEITAMFWTNQDNFFAKSAFLLCLQHNFGKNIKLHAKLIQN